MSINGKYRIVETEFKNGSISYTVERGRERYILIDAFSMIEEWQFCKVFQSFDEAKAYIDRVEGRTIVNRRIVYE